MIFCLVHIIVLLLPISHSGNIAERIAHLADDGILGDPDLALHASDELLMDEEFDANRPFAGLLGDPLLESEVFFAPNDPGADWRLVHRPEEETNPCEEQLLSNDDIGGGRYPKLIAAQFMTNMVVATGPFRNIFCRCRTRIQMICVIYVRKGSVAERAVEMRLDRSNPGDLPPFYVMEIASSSQDVRSAPIMFENSECQPRVYAQIEIETHHDRPSPNSPSTLTRSFSEPSLTREDPKLDTSNVPRSPSSPSRFRYPTIFIRLRQCTGDSNDAVCPILQTPFKHNDVVYILKADTENVRAGREIPCISALGLKRLRTASDDETFIDPFRRLDGARLEFSDYSAYIAIKDNLPQCRSGTDFDRSASAPAATHHRPPLVQSSSSGSSASFQSAQSFDESSNMSSPGAADKLFVSISHSAFLYSRNFYIYVLFFICLFVLIMIKFVKQQETHDIYFMLPS